MEDKNPEIPELDRKYLGKLPPLPATSNDILNKQAKEMEKTKEKLEAFKKHVLKKYPFTLSLGILPPQVTKKFIEEEELPRDAEGKIHLYMIVPEEEFKRINKEIKPELIEKIAKEKQKIWLHIKTPVDVFGMSMDGKFDLVEAIAMAFPLYDKGFLGALRVATIHKSLVLRKFERYIVSYVIAGSLVRGDAKKDSDVDVFVVIDDTDVKRMSRLELREKLRAIIYRYVMEASELAGVKNKLEPQIYLLTEFWESVKDAQPVIFTFIRDGIPLYDRGAFMPWKALLKMGRIKPSPEAIEMFMSIGDKTVTRVKRGLLDLVVHDIYWAAITPSQALLMLNGSPPPIPKHTVREMTKVFVEKEKMLEKRYINILDRIVKIYKDFEHEKIKDIKGAEVDKLVRDVEAYIKRLKELRVQIEKRFNERTIEQIHEDVFGLLKKILGKKSREKLVKDFEKELIKSGKLPAQSLKILKQIVSARKEFKKGKLEKQKIEEARKNATILINYLIDYTQRCDLVSLEKGRMKIRYKEDGKKKSAELVITLRGFFLIEGRNIRRISGEKIEESNIDELNSALKEQQGKKEVKIDGRLFNVLKREFKDFEIVL